MVAKQPVSTKRISPEGNLMVTNLPSLAINWAKVPALRAMMAPWPGLSSKHDIMVPKGISANGRAFPISGAIPVPEAIFCPTCNPFWAMMYFFSPSVYSTKAM